MVTIFLRILSLVIRQLPYSICQFLAGLLAFILFSVIRVRRNVVLDNINNTFGDKLTLKDRIHIAKNMYNHFLLMLLEYIRLQDFKKEDIATYLNIQNIEFYHSTLSEGKGLVFISGHIGNWELGVATLALQGYPTAVYARPLHNKPVNQWINSIRESHQIQVIGRKYGLREIIQTLGQNKAIGFLIDQDARKSGIFIDFLGRPASTFKGPAYCAIKAGCPVLPCFIIRNKGLLYNIFIEKPIYPNPAEPVEKEIERITRYVSELLESYIKKYPEQYFWFHRRWKSSPENYQSES